MKKLLLVLLLSGCGWVNTSDWDKALKACQNYEGLHEIFMAGGRLTASCRNGQEFLFHHESMPL